ncbi:Gfo/Idh/MocA family oxidoreductase [Candidatus Poribacteria bacterium]|nr:Gfo/Idh/MocA family oxidoreductase [Candidatus Poribacteria bacterium]
MTGLPLGWPLTTVVAIADRNASRRQSVADEFSLTHTYGDYRQLLENPEIDAVYLATSPQMNGYRWCLIPFVQASMCLSRSHTRFVPMKSWRQSLGLELSVRRGKPDAFKRAKNTLALAQIMTLNQSNRRNRR